MTSMWPALQHPIAFGGRMLALVLWVGKEETRKAKIALIYAVQETESEGPDQPLAEKGRMVLGLSRTLFFASGLFSVGRVIEG